MKLHPFVFALMTYGITAVVALGVYLIVRLIALTVRRKGKTSASSTEPASTGDTAS